jgi:hypothetical protein
MTQLTRWRHIALNSIDPCLIISGSRLDLVSTPSITDGDAHECHACMCPEECRMCVCVCVWCPTDRPVDLLRSPSLLTPVVERSDHLLIRTCFFLAVKHVFIMSWFEQLDGFCKLTERVVPCGDDEHDAEWLRGDPSCRREREQPGGDLEQEQVSDTVTSS